MQFCGYSTTIFHFAVPSKKKDLHRVEAVSKGPKPQRIASLRVRTQAPGYRFVMAGLVSQKPDGWSRVAGFYAELAAALTNVDLCTRDAARTSSPAPATDQHATGAQ